MNHQHRTHNDDDDDVEVEVELSRTTSMMSSAASSSIDFQQLEHHHEPQRNDGGGRGGGVASSSVTRSSTTTTATMPNLYRGGVSSMAVDNTNNNGGGGDPFTAHQYSSNKNNNGVVGGPTTTASRLVGVTVLDDDLGNEDETTNDVGRRHHHHHHHHHQRPPPTSNTNAAMASSSLSDGLEAESITFLQTDLLHTRPLRKSSSRVGSSANDGTAPTVTGAERRSVSGVNVPSHGGQRSHSHSYHSYDVNTTPPRPIAGVLPVSSHRDPYHHFGMSTPHPMGLMSSPTTNTNTNTNNRGASDNRPFVIIPVEKAAAATMAQPATWRAPPAVGGPAGRAGGRGMPHTSGHSAGTAFNTASATPNTQQGGKEGGEEEEEGTIAVFIWYKGGKGKRNNGSASLGQHCTKSGAALPPSSSSLLSGEEASCLPAEALPWAVTNTAPDVVTLSGDARLVEQTTLLSKDAKKRGGGGSNSHSRSANAKDSQRADKSDAAHAVTTASKPSSQPSTSSPPPAAASAAAVAIVDKAAVEIRDVRTGLVLETIHPFTLGACQVLFDRRHRNGGGGLVAESNTNGGGGGGQAFATDSGAFYRRPLRADGAIGGALSATDDGLVIEREADCIELPAIARNHELLRRYNSTVAIINQALVKNNANTNVDRNRNGNALFAADGDVDDPFVIVDENPIAVQSRHNSMLMAKAKAESDRRREQQGGGLPLPAASSPSASMYTSRSGSTTVALSSATPTATIATGPSPSVTKPKGAAAAAAAAKTIASSAYNTDNGATTILTTAADGAAKNNEGAAAEYDCAAAVIDPLHALRSALSVDLSGFQSAILVTARENTDDNDEEIHEDDGDVNNDGKRRKKRVAPPPVAWWDCIIIASTKPLNGGGVSMTAQNSNSSKSTLRNRLASSSLPIPAVSPSLPSASLSSLNAIKTRVFDKAIHAAYALKWKPLAEKKALRAEMVRALELQSRAEALLREYAASRSGNRAVDGDYLASGVGRVGGGNDATKGPKYVFGGVSADEVLGKERISTSNPKLRTNKDMKSNGMMGNASSRTSQLAPLPATPPPMRVRTATRRFGVRLLSHEKGGAVNADDYADAGLNGSYQVVGGQQRRGEGNGDEDEEDYCHLSEVASLPDGYATDDDNHSLLVLKDGADEGGGEWSDDSDAVEEGDAATDLDDSDDDEGSSNFDSDDDFDYDDDDNDELLATDYHSDIDHDENEGTGVVESDAAAENDGFFVEAF